MDFNTRGHTWVAFEKLNLTDGLCYNKDIKFVAIYILIVGAF